MKGAQGNLLFCDDSDSEEEHSEKGNDFDKEEDFEREAAEDSDALDLGLTEGDSDRSVD